MKQTKTTVRSGHVNRTVILIVTAVCFALILIVVLAGVSYGSYHKKDNLIVLQNTVLGNPPEIDGIYISPGFSCGKDESNLDCYVRAKKCQEAGTQDCPQSLTDVGV